MLIEFLVAFPSIKWCISQHQISVIKDIMNAEDAVIGIVIVLATKYVTKGTDIPLFLIGKGNARIPRKVYMSLFHPFNYYYYYYWIRI